MTVFLGVVAIILMMIGLAGTILPFLPGTPIAFLGFWIYAASTHFTSVSETAVWVFLALTIITILFDLIAPLLGAKKYKMSAHGTVGSVVGSLIGILTLGPLGAILGPIAGTLIGELATGRKVDDAVKSVKGLLVGYLGGMILKLIVVVSMIGYFLAKLI